MKKVELTVWKDLCALGLDRRAVVRNVDWGSIRAMAATGAAPQALTQHALTGLAAGSLLGPLTTVPATLADEGAGLLGKLVDPLLPKSPPLVAGLPPVEGNLTNCTVVALGEVAEGDYMRLTITNNGSFFPGDDEGRVEVITHPPLPAPPNAPAGTRPEIVGNSGMVITGPRFVWLHLHGPEDAAGYEFQVFPKSAR